MPEQGGYIVSPETRRTLDQIIRWWNDNELQNSNPKRGFNAQTQQDFMVKVKVTSAIASQGGRYKGKIIRDGVKDIAPESTNGLVASDLGTLSDNEDVIIWNLAEIGSSTHSLDLGDDAQCVHVGYLLSVDNAQKMSIVSIGGVNGENGFWVRITASGAISGSPNRYEYTGVRQMTWVHGQFQDQTGSSAFGDIFNELESYNSASGFQGNGENLSEYPGGTTVRPIPNNAVRWCRAAVDCFGEPEYFVDYKNSMSNVRSC